MGPWKFIKEVRQTLMELRIRQYVLSISEGPDQVLFTIGIKVKILQSTPSTGYKTLSVLNPITRLDIYGVGAGCSLKQAVVCLREFRKL